MNQRRVRVWHSSGRVRRKTAPTGVGVVIPFLKVYIALTAPERTDSQFMLQRTDSQLSEPFSFTYLLYMRERFSAVGASCARDIARKP